MKILLLPGLGDVHWVLLKLQDWLRAQGHKNITPEVSIWDFDGRPRTIDYFDRVPWVKNGGYFTEPLEPHKEMFRSLYMTPGINYYKDFLGFDYIIGTNGDMRNGVPFKDILDGAACNHEYGPVLKPEDTSYGEVAKKFYGQYFVLCFSDLGMFRTHWTPCMRASQIKRMLAELKRAFPNYKLVFTGCTWDAPFMQKILAKKDINLVGQTNLGQFLGLLQYSAAYIGWCGGNSIIAQHLQIPTIVWWSKRYFPKHDRQGWESPTARHLILEAEDYNLDTGSKIIRELKKYC